MYLEISPISEMHRVRPDLVASEEIGQMNMNLSCRSSARVSGDQSQT